MSKKVLKKFRSTNTLYEDYSMDIAPMVVTGESSQTEVVSAGGGKMYLTRGEKHQSRCMHLCIDAKEKDPVRKFYKQMDDVLEQARRDGQELPQYQPKNVPRGSLLEKNDDFVCCVNETQGQVEISMVIDLSKDVDVSEKLHQNYIYLSKCLHYNEDSLKRLCKQIAKRGCN